MVAVIAVVVAVGLVVGGNRSREREAVVGTVEVTGTVTDAQTGEPVAGAYVTAERHSVVSGDDGGFALTAPADGVVTVTSDRYEPADVAADASLEVTLQPVSASGTVTSQLTGSGVTATVLLGDVEVAISAVDGTFTAYRVVEGDVLTVQAPGHLSADVEVMEGRVDVVLVPEAVTAQDQVRQWVAGGDYASVSAWIDRSDVGQPSRPCRRTGGTGRRA